MKVLLVGGGGREHALAWRLAQSENCTELYCAPGNAGIEECADLVDIAAEDIDGLVSFAKDKDIDLVVVGPEAPLVLGLADRLATENIKVFGPSSAAAALEGSKGFMKDICAKYNIPTAAYGRFTDIAEARKFIADHGAPIVIKTDGLAAGKGVIIAQSVEEAQATAEDMLSGASFGDAGRSIVIEEFMEGEELSFFALADGKSVLPLASAQDHKRAFDGDEGPNTGGMGAYSPAHMMTEALADKITKTIIRPTIDGMAAEGTPFTGVLFAGIMLVGDIPKLIEFNVRFGDPECQALMKRLRGDLLEILLAGAEGRLEDAKEHAVWLPDTAMCVVMAANGYPASYAKNTPIKGVQEADHCEKVKVFHAGTEKDEGGVLVNTGGRVLGVTGRGDTVAEAQKRTYEAVAKIDWPDGFYRSDIGHHALAAEAAKSDAA